MLIHIRKLFCIILVLSGFCSSFAQSGMDSLMLAMNKNKVQYEDVSEAEPCMTLQKYYKHLGFTTGCWIPSGSLAIFGVHPEVGLIVGFKYERWSCDMNVNMRFLKTPDPYRVRRYENIEESQRFNAVNVGLEAGFDLLNLPQHKIAALVGIGYEGFRALQRDNVAGLGPVNINTYNIGFGAAYTYHVNTSFYYGFQAKCHFIDYTLSESMNYRGVPFTLKLKVGWLIEK